MYLLICFVATLIITVLLVYRIHRNYSFLKEIPMPPCNFLLGHLPEFFKSKGLLEKFTNFGIQYGGVYRVYIPPMLPTLIVADPTLIQYITTSKEATDKSKDYIFLKNWLGRGLLTAESSFWKPNRRMLTPCFGRLSLMLSFVNVFEQNGEELMKSLKDQIENTNIDVFPIMKTYTMNVMCETSMGVSKFNCNAYKEKYFNCIRTLQEITANRVQSTLKRIDFLYHLTADYRREKEALETVLKYFDIIMDERLKNKNAHKDTNKEETALTFLDILLESEEKFGLTKEYIREEMNTFLFGGHDTTATGISFTLYALSRNPKIQENVLAEQNEIFGSFCKDLKVSYTELQQMKYLELVIKEALRMFPPIPFIGRKFSSPVKLEGCCTLSKNVGIFIYGCHHNPKYFPEPKKFIPERFLSEIPPGAFVPFSNGPRNCIGNKFALLQMKSCVSKVVRNFKLMPPKPDYEIELVSEMTLVAKNGIRISLENRLPLKEKI